MEENPFGVIVSSKSSYTSEVPRHAVMEAVLVTEGDTEVRGMRII